MLTRKRLSPSVVAATTTSYSCPPSVQAASEGTIALVMELVEGPTLADRIGTGAIPIDQALPIAKQIAEALEAAHEHSAQCGFAAL